MFIASMLGWWYGHGWKDQLVLFMARLTKVGDFFSIGLLAKSLFAPFRQISNDRARADAPVNVQLQIWFDRIFSRCIGAVMRAMLIIAGGLIYLFVALTGIVWVGLWPVLPFLPVVGLVGSIAGGLL